MEKITDIAKLIVSMVAGKVEIPKTPRKRVFSTASPYWDKIEKRLGELTISVMELVSIKQGMIAETSDAWTLDHVGYNAMGLVCELCDHNPINNLYFIRNKTTQKIMMIGSECAVNYVGIDIVEAVRKIMNTKKLKMNSWILWSRPVLIKVESL